MKVIAYKNLPSKLPTYQAIVVGLLLDRIDAPLPVWGVVGVIYGALFCEAIRKLINQKQLEI